MKKITTITAVPVLTGFPPSVAVRINLYIFCVSRSNGFSKTSNGNFLPSVLVFSLNVKCWLSLSLYVCTELIPISGSSAFCKINCVP
uniref:Uncharacterized protein n=1 Tax=Leptobrachium leishanense TaxID=445787 RepID=A0A8C5MH59_9ANUR